MLGATKQLVRHALNRTGFDIVRAGSAVQQERPRYHKALKALEIPGWFSPEECHALYVLTALSEGSILEIGHFLGRSTACICEALADTGKSRTFRSYDLGFRSVQDFKAFYDDVHKKDIKPPALFRSVYERNTTSTALAMDNLTVAGLDRYVTLISGNAFELDRDRYDLIFCDAMHDSNEIAANLPKIIERSKPKCLWAFHDVNPTNLEVIRAAAPPASLIDLRHTLGVFIHTG